MSLFKEEDSFLSFQEMPLIEKTFLDSGLLSSNLVSLLKTICLFLYETLCPFDANTYSLASIEEHLCSHPDLVCTLLAAFEYKCHPQKQQTSLYIEELALCKKEMEKLKTPARQILGQAVYFVEDCLKTNFYKKDKSIFCFRLDPVYLEKIPHDRAKIFPEIPFAIFFMKGPLAFGFHIRFRDLARGGLRTVIPKSPEKAPFEKGQIFSECYNLAYTQQKKNKDIPEGGAKGVIFLEIDNQDTDCLYEAQKSYIKGLLQLVNCEEDGSLKDQEIIDYWKQPEYLYLGPDENMQNPMIEWIADYSAQSGYKPGIAFISSKPTLGINHKEFGVTSFGINVYMEEVLKHLNIDPLKTPFTVKMTGGPDGDVAGNQMLNLYRYHPLTAKLLTTIDISGIVFDPSGIALEILQALFYKEKPICDYPGNKLSPGGFLLDTRTKKQEGVHGSKTLLIENKEGSLIEKWLSEEEVSAILQYTIHKTKADVFIPAGGRPKTLNEKNIGDFLDKQGHPTSKAIVEGANLYLTPEARTALEKKGVLIIKDSSANKGGVICSSFEVLSNLCLSPKEFLEEKPFLAEDILNNIALKSQEEALLLLNTPKTPSCLLADISDKISEKINAYTDLVFSCLHPLTLSNEISHPFNEVLLDHCLPTLRNKYRERVLSRVPAVHKKAIIACHIASKMVYKKGLSLPIPLLNTEKDLLSLISENKTSIFDT